MLTRTFLLVAIAVLFAPFASAQEADLLVTKSGPAEAAAGTDVTYEITVLNIGPDDATSVELNDVIPGSMTFVSASNDGAFTCTTPSVGSGGTITCTAATLAAGASVDFDFVFNIPAGTPPSTFFTNIAAISSSTFDPNEENNTGIAVTATPAADTADMFVEKEGPAAAPPDGDVTFVLTLGNAGPDDASTVSMTDSLPGDMTFVSLVQNSGPTLSCTTPPVGLGGTINCTAATFPAGQVATFTLTTHIPAGTPAGTEYQNGVNVTSANDQNPENDSSSTVLIVSAVDMSVTKTGPATVGATANIAYTITVSNAGPDAAFAVELTDILPAGTTFVSLIQNSGPTGVCATPPVGGNSTIVCNWNFFAAAASAVFTLTIDPEQQSEVVNTATVDSDSFDTNTGNNSSTVTTEVEAEVDLVVTKTGPASADAGTNVTYAISVTNDGPSTADDLTLTDNTPAGTTFVSLTQTSGPTLSCTTPALGSTGTITCTAATFAAEATASFDLVLAVNASATGSVSNTATASSSTTEPDTSDNSATATTTLTGSADLSVTKTGPTGVAPGGTLTYTINVANAGPSDASTVTLTDILPAETTFVSLTQTTGPTFSCTTPAVGANGTVTCTLATFAASASASFTLVVEAAANATGPISNTASISSATADPDASDSSSTTAAAVAVPTDLSITKTASPGPYNAGANVTYTLLVTNNGPATATGVTVTDILPAGTTLVTATSTQGICSGTTTVTCSVGTLASAANATITLVVTLPPFSGPVVNTATVTATEGDPNPANNSSTSAITVAAVEGIPTLSPLALIAISVMLGLAGFIALRKF